jgi:hypothetical protein
LIQKPARDRIHSIPLLGKISYKLGDIKHTTVHKATKVHGHSIECPPLPSPCLFLFNDIKKGK